MVRSLEHDEVVALLNSASIAHLATLDDDGYPHVTPIWFLWSGGAFYFACDAHRPHVRRLTKNRRAGVVIDTEAPRRADGERPNQQVRAIGHATVAHDIDYEWSTRIWIKYGGDSAGVPARLAGRIRCVIRLQPTSVVAIGSV